jgi:2-oxoglutarate ferredoxin oxidoreductase subunit alpha
MAAGVNFCSFYPMTPGTSVALTLAAKGQAMGVVVEQAEDEIAAVNMALGASFAGARVLVPTSGGGFALLVEGISLAGIIETPVFIVVALRPGPATGLPPRTEQADLNLVLYAGHGEFPRASSPRARWSSAST